MQPRARGRFRTREGSPPPFDQWQTFDRPNGSYQAGRAWMAARTSQALHVIRVELTKSVDVV